MLSKYNSAWILLRWNIKFFKEISYPTNFVIATWPYSYKGFYAYRRFQAKANGEIFADVNSQVVLLDLKKRRPMRINNEIGSLYPRPGGEKSLFFNRIKEYKEYDFHREYPVNFLDIDYYKHVNNSIYIKWAINSLDFNFLKSNRMEEVDILYKKEVLLGESVSVKSKLVNNNINQMIYNRDGDIITKIESKWTSRGD